MRTTISLDDRIYEAVKRRAAAAGRSVSAYIAGVLDDALKKEVPTGADRPFRLITVDRGGPFGQIDFDRPRGL